MELGIYSFVENTIDPATGRPGDPRQRIANLLEEIELADQVGLDVYGIGEHHRPEYLASSPATLLAAAAARTQTIRLASAVSVLSSDDPVRVFQDFATLDLISNGRAEIVAGRGSFIESFPLFGYDLEDYNELFAEKLELLLKIRDSERLTWKGKHRPAIDDQGIYPRPVQDPLPVWVAIGGTPASAARAGRLGLPLALAILGGRPKQFAPLADLYRAAWTEAGHEEQDLNFSVNVHGFVADTNQQAADIFYPGFAVTMNKIGRERGWAPISRRDYESMIQPGQAVFVGDPERFAEFVVDTHKALGNNRFLVQLTVGSLPHKDVMRAIELYGTKVAPLVKAETQPASARS